MGSHAPKDEGKIKMTIIWMSFLCTMAHVPSLILRYIPFKDRTDKNQKKQLLFWYGLGLVINFFLYIKVEEKIGVSISFYKMNLMLFCVIMGGVNILVLRGYVKEQLFTFGLTALIILLTYAVAAYLVEIVGYKTIPQGLIIENIFGLLLYVFIYPWIRKLMRNTITPFLNIDSQNYWNTIWFIPIAMFLGTVFSLGMEDYIETPLQLMSRMFTGLATLMLCQNIAKDYRRIQEHNQITQQIEQQKKYYEALTEAVKVEREARHNFKHQLAAMQGFLDTGNIEELRTYCDSMQVKLAKITEIPYTGNAAADGVLYHYACLAEEKGVFFSSRCRFNSLNISDTDLCCILGNALDNALTASEGYEGEKYIRVAAQQEKEMLLITVDNSFDGFLIQEGEKIFSRKRKQEEGIGMKSMRQICEKYGGSCSFQTAGNEFEASFLLMLEQK